VEYFSDGCAAQYKNRKSFHNICEHEKDFGKKASWSFFLTSHGKFPCDAIGGTVKRSTPMKSLRWPLENQILNINDMVAYCSKTLTNITFQILPKEELKSHEAKLKGRFETARTIKGTRTFHYFKLLSATRMGMKRISDNSQFALEVDILQSDDSTLMHNVSVGHYICAAYDKNWYTGIIKQIALENNDFLMALMHPHGPSHSFRWPEKQDLCWVPFQHRVCAISAASLVNTRGQYELSTQSKDQIENAWLSNNTE